MPLIASLCFVTLQHVALLCNMLCYYSTFPPLSSNGMVQYSVICYDTLWRGMISYNTIWYNTLWYGMTQNGTVYGMLWHCNVCYGSLLLYAIV